MMQIWKFRLTVTDEQTITIPRGAAILSVQIQGPDETICMWALVDPEEPALQRRIFIAGTGNDIPKAFAYPFIGTVQMLSGALVWHIFAELR